MAMDLTALTLNAKEVQEFAEIIVEKTFNMPELQRLHNVWTGVKMKEQIVFASLMGKVGIKDTTCARPKSGAETVLTQRYWEPLPVGDTLEICQTNIDGLFKAYYNKINSFRDLYEIQGTDEEVFLALLFAEAIMESIYRLGWLGDTAVVQAGAAQEGVVLAADVKFYDSVEGLWKRIFTEVAATTIPRYTITENNAALGSQETLAAGRSIEIFDAVWANADSRLKADTETIWYVSNAIFENYTQYLTSKGENWTLDYTMNGFVSVDVKYKGKTIVNMENVWDRLLAADFVLETTTSKLYLPNRVVLSTPQNLPIGTLNDGDWDEMESWYDKDNRLNKMAFGYTLDTLVLEGYMASVAY